MKHPIRTLMIMLVIIVTMAVTFLLALSITGNNLEWATAGEDVVIDLNEDPNEVIKVKEDSFWNRYRNDKKQPSEMVDEKTTEQVTTEEGTTQEPAAKETTTQDTTTQQTDAE